MKNFWIVLLLFACSFIGQAQPRSLNVTKAAPATVSAKNSCTLTSPCSASLNVPWDSAGVPMTGNGIWGYGAAQQWPFQFTNVPAGYSVQITRLQGDLVAWPHGTPKPGSAAGVLWGFWSDEPITQPFQYSDSSCWAYDQGAISAQNPSLTEMFDRTVYNGLLSNDNKFTLQVALFLSELGVSVHQELTLEISYAFVPTPAQ